MTELVNNIQTLLTYFVPGAVTILVYHYLMDKKQDNSTLMIYSIIVSSLIQAMVRTVTGWFGYDITGSVTVCMIACSVIGMLVAISIYLFIKCKFAAGICDKLHITPTANVILNTIDLDNDTVLFLTLKNGKELCGKVATIDSEQVTLKEYYIEDARKVPDAELHEDGLLNVAMGEILYYETCYADDGFMEQYK